MPKFKQTSVNLHETKEQLDKMLNKINQGKTRDEKVSVSRFIRQLINIEFEKHKDLS